MTLPDERYRAVKEVENFLRDLMDTKKTPRVPVNVRRQAYSLLRHYPSSWDLDRVSERSPEVFQARMDPLTRMVMQYEQDKEL